MIRIVKLTFTEETLPLFLEYFESIKTIVNTYPGCNGMQMLQDIHDSKICFTYSKWGAESDLNAYRDANQFKEIWGTIKPWFGARAEAWSVQEKYDGFLFCK